MLAFTAPEPRTELVQAPYASVLEHTSSALQLRQHGPGFCFSRQPITGSRTSPRGSGMPPMTEVQAEALDMVHFTAVEHCVSVKLQKGDMQLVN